MLRQYVYIRVQILRNIGLHVDCESHKDSILLDQVVKHFLLAAKIIQHHLFANLESLTRPKKNHKTN